MVAPEMGEADVLIAPRISVSRMSAKDEQESAIQAGYEAARAALPGIMAVLREGVGKASPQL
jgi:NTE family protein